MQWGCEGWWEVVPPRILNLRVVCFTLLPRSGSFTCMHCVRGWVDRNVGFGRGVKEALPQLCCGAWNRIPSTNMSQSDRLGACVLRAGGGGGVKRYWSVRMCLLLRSHTILWISDSVIYVQQRKRSVCLSVSVCCIIQTMHNGYRTFSHKKT